MKKKLLTLGLVATLGLPVGANVLAAEINVGAPTTTPIPSFGSIGLGINDDYYNHDGDFNPDTVVSVSVPTQTSWFVSEQTGGNVMSSTYRITNHSENANLAVTFEGYEQTGDDRVNLDGLTLNLTGDLAEDGLGRDITNSDTTGTYSTILDSRAVTGGTEGDTWEFGFGGNFVGNIPATALTPTFDLNLSFAVDSYTVNNSDNS